MRRSVSLVGVAVALSFLFSGCATSVGAKAKQSDTLTNQVTSLETQMGEVNQRLGELIQRQSELESHLAGRGTVATPAATQKKVTSLSNRKIQEALKAAGFYTGAVDGKVGPKTKEAIKEFQRSRGLKADGVVGPKTALELAQFLPAEESR